MLTPREEVPHPPVTQTIHLRGVDSLRVVYFLSLLFPSFTSAAWSLPPELLRKVSDGKLEMDASLSATPLSPNLCWEGSTAAPVLLWASAWS